MPSFLSPRTGLEAVKNPGLDDHQDSLVSVRAATGPSGVLLAVLLFFLDRWDVRQQLGG